MFPTPARPMLTHGYFLAWASPCSPQSTCIRNSRWGKKHASCHTRPDDSWPGNHFPAIRSSFVSDV